MDLVYWSPRFILEGSPRFILDVGEGVQDLSWTSGGESKIYLGRRGESPRFILDVGGRGVQDLSWTSGGGESKIYLRCRGAGSPRFILDVG